MPIGTTTHYSPAEFAAMLASLPQNIANRIAAALNARGGNVPPLLTRAGMQQRSLSRQYRGRKYNPAQAAAIFYERQRDREETERRQAGREKERQAREAARQAEQQRKAGPLPDLLATAQRKMTAYGEYVDPRRGGGSPDDMVAKELKRQAMEAQGYAARKFAGMSPADQAAAMPKMVAMEKQNRQLKEEEAARSGLNKELTRGQKALHNFIEGMARGNPMGAALGGLSALGSGPALLATAIGTVVGKVFERYQAEQEGIRRGQAELNPVLEQERINRKKLVEFEQARQEKQSMVTRSESQLAQLQRQAYRAGMTANEDPNRVAGYWSMPWNLNRDRLRAAATGVMGMSAYWGGRIFGGASRQEAQTVQNRIEAQHYQAFLRDRGIEPQPYRPDVAPLPGMSAGVSSIMSYQSELQTNSLSTSASEKDIMQEQRDEQLNAIKEAIESTNSLLAEIRDRPGWH